MSKNNVRTKYIKSLLEDKENLSKMLEESTKDSLDALLEEKVNRSLRQILAESDDSYEEEEVDTEETIDDVTKGNEEEGEEEEETTIEVDDDTIPEEEDEDNENEEVCDDIEDCKDEDGNYDLTGKDINTVLKILQHVKLTDGDEIIPFKDGEATIETNDLENDTDVDFENKDDEDEDASANEFELDLDNLELGSNDDNEDDEATFEFEFDDEDGAEDNEDEEDLNESNLGYTTKYQKNSAMTMPTDTADDNGYFNAGVPKGGENNKRRWVGTKGANGGNPYTDKIKSNMNEMDECGDSTIFEVVMDDTTNEDFLENEDTMMETHTRGMARKHNSVGRVELPNTSWQENEEDTRNVYIGGKQKRNTARNTVSESKQLQNIKRKANVILAENEELRDIAKQIKDKLNEAVVINSSLAKVVKLVTENSTTRDEKINILNRFNKVNNLKESRELYETISSELQQAHSVNNRGLNNTLTEVKGQNKNLIVETNMLAQSEDLKQILDLQKRLMKIK